MTDDGRAAIVALANALLVLLTDPAISPCVDRKAREQAEEALARGRIALEADPPTEA